MALVEFQDVAADGTVGESNAVTHTAWDHGDLVRTKQDVAELGLDV
jgi:hypothetical protein